VYSNDNELRVIPNFSTYSNKANLTLTVHNNRLDFSNLEWLKNTGIKAVTMVPLKNINDISTAGYKIGSPLLITARPGGVNSTITWEKQGANATWSSVNSTNQDATQKTYLRNTPATTEQGFYRWKMTNTLITGVTLYSDPIYSGELSTLEQTKTLYNGLITAASWRTDKAYGTNGSDLTGMYLYDYDEKYQLKEAVFAIPNFSASRYTYTLAGNNYRLSGMEYDPNGNIKKLKRFKDNGQIQHDFGYTYATNTNQLTKVSSYADYTYNAIGQTTLVDKLVNTDSEKDQYIDYDVTGKVVAVFVDAGKTKATTRYTYDDRGFRLTKSDYDANGALTKTFWYIRDASGNVLSIYEQTGAVADQFTNFKQTEVPIYGAGKLATYYPIVSVAADEDGVDAGSTSYEITDHLGNVRAIIRTQTNEYTATMEDDGTPTYTNPRVKENVYFKNLLETQKRDPQMNHTSSKITAAPSMSSYLYWITGAQNGNTPDKKSVGPAIALNVSPGDQIDISAWARFKIKATYSKASMNNILAMALASNFAFSNGLENIAQATSKFSQALMLNPLSPNNSSTGQPFAYINYVIFDNQNVALVRDVVQVPMSAGFEDTQKANGYTQNNLVKFATPITINQAGYIYVWVSNESEDTEVWFDDLSIMHHKPLVAQATDYGAWGEVLREQKWVDLDAKYRYGYQGQYAEKDDETGWNHFQLREYDPVIGRWTSKDPKGQYYSPYVGMSNNPVSGVDPDGGYTKFGARWRNFVMGGSGIFQDGKDGNSEVWGFKTSNGGVTTFHFGEHARNNFSNAPTIQARESNGFGRFKEQNTDIVSQFGYSIVDNLYITAQLGSNRRNLEGYVVDRDEITDAGINTILLLSPGPKAAPAKGVSVIGPKATYREFAKKIGANFLDVIDEAWSMRKNVQFLQGVVKRGDDVIFAGRRATLDPNSVLAQEIRYLERHGYSWIEDIYFSRMIKK
jgi:RHS repeat-associated protein